MNRYDRQMRLPEVGATGQTALKQARVLVVGAGGLGAHLLPLLAGAGVGFIRLYDGDKVEEHNLHRQTLFRESDVGKAKAQAAASHLNALNAEVTCDAISQHLTPDNASDALADIDLVVDAADRLAVTYLLSDACRDRQLPLVSASAIKQQGYVGGFCGKGPDYRALFPQLTTAGGNCNSQGVFGPVVATLGSIQAQMALNILLGLTPSAIGQLWRFDFANWQLSRFRFNDAPINHDGIPLIGKQALTPNDCVIELRPPEEAPTPLVSQAIRLAIEELDDWTPPDNQRLVFACASGVRATRAALALRERGAENLAVLAASFYSA